MTGAGPSGTASSALEPIRLSGHLDGRCSSELREVITAHLALHPDRDLRLDMRDVDSVDLTVLRLLAAVAVRLQREKHRLILQDCSPSVRRLLTQGVWRRLFVLQRSQPPGP